jgi:hypothetical protein
MKKNYDDIINLPHHVSDHHPRMSRSDRAGQFSPFAALTGYEQAVEETARRVDRKLEIDDYRAEQINEGLNYIKDNIRSMPLMDMTYFVRDQHKDGGSYLSGTLKVVRIDEYQHQIVDSSGLKIDFEDIYELNPHQDKEKED